MGSSCRNDPLSASTQDALVPSRAANTISPTPPPSEAARPAPSIPLVHAWMTWRSALCLILGVTLLRAAYNAWISPWDLVGDEAYYWQQGRHLALCYNEKGPLLPWMVGAACRAFGDVEWAVRLPMVVASGLGAWGI